MGLTTMKQADFNRLSVDELLNVREIINGLLATKIGEERRNLELRMETLNRADRLARPFAEGASKFDKIPPKYQNPENPAETWAGRGKTPRWMAAALKKGKKKEDFLIAGGILEGLSKSRRR